MSPLAQTICNNVASPCIGIIITSGMTEPIGDAVISKLTECIFNVVQAVTSTAQALSVLPDIQAGVKAAAATAAK